MIKSQVHEKEVKYHLFREVLCLYLQKKVIKHHLNKKREHLYLYISDDDKSNDSESHTESSKNMFSLSIV